MERGAENAEGIWKPSFLMPPSDIQTHIEAKCLYLEGLTSGHKAGEQKDQWDKPGTVDTSLISIESPVMGYPPPMQYAKFS